MTKLLIILLLVCPLQLEAASPSSIIQRQRINRVKVINGKMTREEAAEITSRQIEERRLYLDLKIEGYKAAKARNSAYLAAHRQRLMMKDRFVIQTLPQSLPRLPNQNHIININTGTTSTEDSFQ